MFILYMYAHVDTCASTCDREIQSDRALHTVPKGLGIYPLSRGGYVMEECEAVWEGGEVCLVPT